MDKRIIGELLLILGVVLFVGGAGAFITGKAEQIPGIGALALTFIGAGASMKKEKSKE